MVDILKTFSDVSFYKPDSPLEGRAHLFNACISEWRQTLKKLEKAEAEIIRSEV